MRAAHQGNLLALAALLLGGVLVGPAALAQNLATFVADPANGATPLQQSAGIAVQNTCVHMASVADIPIDEASARGDLFRRCNELVETARALQPASNADIDRSLGISGAELLGAVQQISGEELSAQGDLTTRVANGQFSNIGGRLNALRLGGASVAARGRVAAFVPATPGAVLSLWSNGTPRQGYRDAASRYEAFAPLAGSFGFSLADSRSTAMPRHNAAQGDGQTGTPGVENPWGWFIDGSYNRGDRDATVSEDGFDFDAFSISGGVDYNFGSAVVGVSLGYDDYEADFDQSLLVSGGKVKVRGPSGSLFGAWFGERLSVNGIVSYGKPDSDIERSVVYASNTTCTPACGNVNRTLTGSPDSRYFAAGATLMYDVISGGAVDLTATGSLAYRSVKIDSFSETDPTVNGGLALAYDEQSINSLRSILGLMVSRAVSTGFGVMTPSLRAEWHHEFRDDPRTLRAKYVVNDALLPAEVGNFSNCLSCFQFVTDSQDADFAVVGVGLSFLFAGRLQGYIEYEGLFGVSHLTSNAIGIGLRGQF